jgi:hypothetical protein
MGRQALARHRRGAGGGALWPQGIRPLGLPSGPKFGPSGHRRSEAPAFQAQRLGPSGAAGLGPRAFGWPRGRGAEALMPAPGAPWREAIGRVAIWMVLKRAPLLRPGGHWAQTRGAPRASPRAPNKGSGLQAPGPLRLAIAPSL